jgi:hypothetical protein
VVGDVGWTTDGGAEDLEAVVTKMAGAVGGGGVEEFPAEGEGDTFEDGGARSGEEDATLVGVEDETKRGSMLREEGEDESDIGKRHDESGQKRVRGGGGAGEDKKRKRIRGNLGRTLRLGGRSPRNRRPA